MDDNTHTFFIGEIDESGWHALVHASLRAWCLAWYLSHGAVCQAGADVQGCAPEFPPELTAVSDYRSARICDAPRPFVVPLAFAIGST
jgi:hypothetical protein